MVKDKYNNHSPRKRYLKNLETRKQNCENQIEETKKQISFRFFYNIKFDKR